MTREIIPITSEEQWLNELRPCDITSTMSAALFGASPYLTIFEVYHAKHSNVHVPFHQTERMHKGRQVEKYVAESVADMLGAIPRTNNDYIRIPGERMASSFDWELVFPDGEVVNLEIKAVDYFQHKIRWEEDEAPPHIEIQVQHEMECADKYERTIIAACTGIYDFHLIERKRDRDMGASIRQAVRNFWRDVNASNEPKPDYYRDAEVIAALYPVVGEQPANKSDDEELEALLSKYSRLKSESSAMQDEAQAVKAQIHYRLGDIGVAYTERYKVTAKVTKGSPGKVVTQDMVGTKINERAPFRQLLVKDMLSNSRNSGEKL